MEAKPAGQARILVIAAVEAERQAILRGLDGDPRFDVVAPGAGVGMAAAAAGAALASGAYRLAVSAGIGGGFAGRAPVGSLVIADAIIAADLGAETREGFQTAHELGFGGNLHPAHQPLAARLTAVLAERFPARTVLTGPVLTVSTATGTAATAEAWRRRHPEAAAEAMEGFGVACAASLCGLPCMEVRGISNAVGPRDRAAWRIGEALQALEEAFSVLKDVLEE
ncbi:futalosine hydrolase [Paenibacillus sp. YN15]|uniref:futalosine hydrolase n=1 Tax=Paenibacillus sp. YN15 TaxID=1742774 RepID=UPI000DCF1095|nr:futalosine hydrolase [Paenibacillus sp. YN15]RAV01768.1 futalosine hydrolase [Paenibacillus sp. YN15]